jgi:DNA-binding CsgD family transcriptional regulator
MKFSDFFRKETQSDQEGRRFDLQLDLLVPLEMLATSRGLTAQEMAADLVKRALLLEQFQNETRKKWQILTPREQEITALIFRGYSSRAIYERLGIANETLRTHVHNILRKFEVSDRKELRQLLRDCNFSSWC